MLYRLEYNNLGIFSAYRTLVTYSGADGLKIQKAVNTLYDMPAPSGRVSYLLGIMRLKIDFKFYFTEQGYRYYKKEIDLLIDESPAELIKIQLNKEHLILYRDWLQVALCKPGDKNR